MALKPYSELIKIDVLPYCEKREARDEKGKKIEVPYLNWAKCVDLLHEHGAETVYYEPLLNANGHSLFMTEEAFVDGKGQSNHCFEVRVRVVIDELNFVVNYPLMNGTYVVRDDTINQLRVSNAQARAFVKGVAIRTGLGLGLWIKGGDDLPDYFPDEDLDLHNVLLVQKRIEQKITEKIKTGKAMKEILESCGVNEKTFKAILGYAAKLAELERRIDLI